MTESQAHTARSSNDTIHEELDKALSDKIAQLMFDDIMHILYDDGGIEMDAEARISRIYDVADNHHMYEERAWNELWPDSPFPLDEAYHEK